jgi:hypothetical protein
MHRYVSHVRVLRHASISMISRRFLSDHILPLAANASTLQGFPTLLQSQYMTKITSEACNHLASNGWAVIDGVFGAEAATALRSEIEALRSMGRMHSNSTHLVSNDGTRTLVPKPGIVEAELSLREIQALVPLCAAIQADTTLQTLLGVHLPQLRLESQAIKLQWNSGSGACFPCHFDSDRSVDNRAVTAIYYINSGWRPEHGGALRLYQFPLGMSSIDIAPLHDRMVLFASQTMLHRVMPSFVERCCFTIWLSGPGGQGRGAEREAQQQQERDRARQVLAGGDTKISDDEIRRAVMEIEPLRKFAAKYVHRKEWARSLGESHEGEEKDALVRRHLEEVRVIERALGPRTTRLLDSWTAGLCFEDAVGGGEVDEGGAAKSKPTVRWL